MLIVINTSLLKTLPIPHLFVHFIIEKLPKMATESSTSGLEGEFSYMKFDPVMVKIFQDTFDNQDRVIGSFVRTLTNICWHKQVLRAVISEDEDSLLAALRVASGMHEFNITRAYQTGDYAEKLNEWLHHAQTLSDFREQEETERQTKVQ